MSTAEASIPPSLINVKALLFDVFGTVVNWRSTVHAELVKRAREKLSSPGSLPEPLRARLQKITDDDDWARFAQEWRNSYGKFTRTFVPGQTPWKDIDTHHHDSLLELLEAWSIRAAYTETEVRSLSLIWHYLAPWPDSSAGLAKLGTAYTTATLSNGNQALLRDLDETGQLGFQHLISSADFGAYKPHPKTYLGAAAKLGLRPDECALVAAHLGDLQAAKSHGFGAIYVERSREEAFSPQEVEEARGWVDLWVAEGEGGFVEVARRLGISN
ncbi:uncharacterized protein JN550_001703 [Neoarthrinium moseri]|uniref:uncharacterized protein n=1 Tax=Neoarthrinium moseri TaxID=1658444 RepID=UPI001FDDDAA6|nr:uncharacterized protein JN550_001703 [Neoarthrinium moseri]KAI1876207.1 hypothetical protein JN550_001703 [Neoarthrinium moseri]